MKLSLWNEIQTEIFTFSDISLKNFYVAYFDVLKIIFGILHTTHETPGIGQDLSQWRHVRRMIKLINLCDEKKLNWTKNL